VVGPYLVGASVVFALGASVLAWSHAIAVGKAAGGKLATIAAGLKRVPLEERPAALLERTEPGSWENELARELVEAPDVAWRVAAANDAVSDLAHALALRAGWPRSAARLAGAASFLLAVVAYIVDHGLDHTLGIIIPGAVAIAACVEAGRRATQATQASRKDVDALIEVVMGPIAREQAEKSELRRRRRREGW
jgi:hypothetical protein